MKSSSATDSKLLGMDVDSFVQTCRGMIESSEYASNHETQARAIVDYLLAIRKELRKKLLENTGGKALPPARALGLICRMGSPSPDEVHDTMLVHALINSYLVEDCLRHGELYIAARFALQTGNIVGMAVPDYCAMLYEAMSEAVAAYAKDISQAGRRAYQEKNALKWDQYWSDVKHLMSVEGKTYPQAVKCTATKYDVNAKTIRRHTSDLKPKSANKDKSKTCP